MHYLYLDIETIPVQDEATRERIIANAKPPKTMKKPETIEKWRKESADDLIAKTALDGAYGEVCCIGCAFDNGPLHTIMDKADEDFGIATAFAHIHKHLEHRVVTVVGHNVLGFDLPFLRKRAMVHGIKLPPWFPRDLKPWSNEVFDTMVQWDAKNFISLDNLAAAFGLEGKGDVDGSMVAQLYAEGEFDKIADYCAADVELTRKIHQQMMKALP